MHPVKFQDGGEDTRYEVNPEYDGNPTRGGKSYVVRFCGEYVSGHATEAEAGRAAREHNRKRLGRA